MGPGGCRFGDDWRAGLPLLVCGSRVRHLLVWVVGRLWDQARDGVIDGSPPARRRPLCLDRPAPLARAGAARGRRGLHRYRMVAEGERSRVYPALARVPAGLFGICAVGTSGGVYATGDAEHGFAIMSVAKPFVFALICQALGPEAARAHLGVNATGLAFNSLAAVERGPGGRTNPMVNAGAIATTSLAPGASAEARWGFLVDGLSRFAGRTLALDEEVYASASATTTATAPWPTCSRATAASAATRPRRSTATPARAVCG